MNNIFQNKKINTKKLLAFGFTKDGDIYSKNYDIMDGDFCLNIKIKAPNIVETKLKETQTDDIYILHLTDATGDFVGKIKKQYNDILKKIEEECFESDVFKTKQAFEIINYIKEKYNSDLEFLWDKFKGNAIARRKDNKKWYLIILTVSKEKLGIKSKEKAEIIDIRAKADKLPLLIQKNNIYPGYHMNKKHWISIILDNSMTINEICKRIDESYILADKK